MPLVFVSYRRDLPTSYVSWIYGGLISRLGRGQVFIDLETGPSPPMGAPAWLKERLSEADVVLAIIDPEWVAALAQSGAPAIDLHRLELEDALRRSGVAVIPVLIEGAQMPARDLLPRSLQALSKKQSFTLPDRSVASIGALVDAIERISERAGGDQYTVGQAGAVNLPLEPQLQLAGLITSAAQNGIVSASGFPGERTPPPAPQPPAPPAPQPLPPIEQGPPPRSGELPAEIPAEIIGSGRTRRLSLRRRRDIFWALLGAGSFALIKWIVTGTPLATASGAKSQSLEEDEIDCTVFAPPSLRRAEPSLVQVFFHQPEEARNAAAMAEEAELGATRRVFRSLRSPVPRGATISAQLRMPGATIEPPSLDSVIWRGRTQRVQFEVAVADPQVTALVGTVALAVDGYPVGHVKFKLRVEEQSSAEPEPVGESAHTYTNAFVSYSHKDRERVLQRLQVMPAFKVRYFQDLLSMPPGTPWTKELERAIDECDLFLLFWSKDASESDWVRREVHRALDRKAGDEEAPPEIFPVILDGPPIVDPWDELRHLQFEDSLLYLMRPVG